MLSRPLEKNELKSWEVKTTITLTKFFIIESNLFLSDKPWKRNYSSKKMTTIKK